MAKQDVQKTVKFYLQPLEFALAEQLRSGVSTLSEISREIEDINLLWEFEDTLYGIQNELDEREQSDPR